MVSENEESLTQVRGGGRRDDVLLGLTTLSETVWWFSGDNNKDILVTFQLWRSSLLLLLTVEIVFTTIAIINKLVIDRTLFLPNRTTVGPN